MNIQDILDSLPNRRGTGTVRIVMTRIVHCIPTDEVEHEHRVFGVDLSDLYPSVYKVAKVLDRKFQEYAVMRQVDIQAERGWQHPAIFGGNVTIYFQKGSN